MNHQAADSVSSSNPTPGRAQGQQRVAFRRLFAFLNIIHLVVLGVTLNSLLFGDLEIWMSFRLLVLATLIAAIATERGWLVLIALLGMLLARETPTRSMMPDFSHAVFAFASLLLVAYAYLASRVKTRISSPIANFLIGTTSNEEGQHPNLNSAQTGVFKRFLFVFIPALMLAVLSLASMSILSLSPTTYRSRWELFRTVDEQDWLLAATSTIIVVLLGVYLVLREFGFRPCNKTAASLYLRSQLSLDFSKEIRVLFNRWNKRRKTLRSESPSPPKT